MRVFFSFTWETQYTSLITQEKSGSKIDLWMNETYKSKTQRCIQQRGRIEIFVPLGFSVLSHTKTLCPKIGFWDLVNLEPICPDRPLMCSSMVPVYFLQFDAISTKKLY